MYRVELARIAAVVSGHPNHGAVAAAQCPDHVVGVISHQQILLARIVREGNVANCSWLSRRRMYEELLHELALLREYLNPVVGAIANVDKSIVRDVGTVDGRPELLVVGSIGLVRTRVGIVRNISIGAPHPFECKRNGIEHDDALVQVAIGHVQLMRSLIHFQPGGLPKLVRVSAIGRALRRMADLTEELPVICKLENLATRRPIAAYPHGAISLDKY